MNYTPPLVTSVPDKPPTDDRPPVKMPPQKTLEEIQAATLSDEQLLILTQHNLTELATVTRENLNMRKVGEVRVYLEVLREMRDTAQGNIKLRQEDKLNTQIAGAGKLIAQLLTGYDRTKTPPAMGPSTGASHELPDNIPEPEMVPGETHVGVEDLEPQSFLPKDD